MQNLKPNVGTVVIWDIDTNSYPFYKHVVPAYLKDASIFECKSIQPLVEAAAGEHCRSYSINWWIAAGGQDDIPMAPCKLSHFKKQSIQSILGDMYFLSAEVVHSGGYNVLFMDGHVSWWEWDGTNYWNQVLNE